MAEFHEYDIGDVVTISAAFYSTANALADPSKVVVQYMTPGSAITRKVYPDDTEVLRSATGLYYLNIAIPTASASAHGVWAYRFEGTTALIAASEHRFHVRDSVFY